MPTLREKDPRAQQMQGPLPPSQMPKLHPPGRRCDEPGCITRLSVYNGRRRCFLHADQRETRMLAA